MLGSISAVVMVLDTSLCYFRKPSNVTCFIIYDKNMKISQFWDNGFMSLSQKYEERVRKFSFLIQHHFKAELYRYIYIIIFGEHL